MLRPALPFILVLIVTSVATAQTSQPAIPALTPEQIALKSSKMQQYLGELEALEEQLANVKQKQGKDFPMVPKLQQKIAEAKDRVQIYADDYNFKHPTTNPASARMLQHELMLISLKKRYDYRLRDFAQDLRNKAIRLNIDGMGMPGRISTREIELAKLTERQLDITRALSQFKSSLTQAKRKDVAPAILIEIEKDSRLSRYLDQIDDIDLKIAEESVPDPEAKQLQKRKAALEQKAQQRRSNLTKSARDATLQSLNDSIEDKESELAAVKDNISTAKQDLGDLTYQMEQYQMAKEEERALRVMRDRVTAQLDRLSLIASQPNPDDPEWKEIERGLFAPATQPASNGPRN